MPSVTFEAPPHKTVTIEAPEGGSVADLCDKYEAPVPFSCRRASCATCRCEVAAGADLLAAPEDEELDILDVLGAPKTHRLACCLKLKAGPGLVVLKPVNDY